MTTMQAVYDDIMLPMIMTVMGARLHAASQYGEARLDMLVFDSPAVLADVIAHTTVMAGTIKNKIMISWFLRIIRQELS